MFGGGFGGFGGFGGGREEQMPEQKKDVDTNGFYEILGVQKSATTEQIRKAFRKKALKQHPDKGGDPDKFKVITGAYDTLSNPEKRQLYDDYGQEGVKNGGPPGGGGLGDLFGMFGGGGRKKSGPVKGKPKLIEIDVTLQQVCNGAMKNVKFSRTRLCEGCDGKGGKNVQKCTKCKGTGQVTKLVQLGPGMYSQSAAKCGDCKGQGETTKQEDKCKDCKGEKIKKTERTLEVGIQSGCPDMHDYIFTGENDEYPGVIPGDVYVRIKIKKHPLFQRRGADLVIIKKISLIEALTGVTMDIKHLDGQKHIIATAPGEVLSNMELKSIRGLGLPFYKDPMSHGNLYIEFIIQSPKKNSLSGTHLQKISDIFGYKIPAPDKKKSVILEQFDEKDLNSNATGEQEDEDDGHHQGGARQVRCENQ